MYCSKCRAQITAVVAAAAALAVWPAAGAGETAMRSKTPYGILDAAQVELRMFNGAYSTRDAIAEGLLQGVQFLQPSVNQNCDLMMRKNSGDEPLIVHSSITERETASESSRNHQEYDAHGNLLHEYVLVRDILGENADGTAAYGEIILRYTAHRNTYDIYGNLKKHESYGWFGEDCTEWEYAYTDGLMTEKREYFCDSDGSANERNVTQYDDKGRIIAYTVARWTDHWFYGKSEEEIAEFVNTNLFTGEDEKSGTLYICDENGAVLREEYYEGSVYVNERYMTKQYSYDERGNCIALRTSEYDGTMGEDWYYDEADRLIMHRSDYGSGGTIYTETYSYNARGKLESVFCDYDNNYYVDSETFYYYDAKENLIRTETTEYCEYDALEFFRIDAMYYDGSRWIVSVEKTEYTYH